LVDGVLVVMNLSKRITNSEEYEAVTQYIPEETLLDYTVHSIWTGDDQFVNDLFHDTCDSMLDDHVESDCAILLNSYQPLLDLMSDELKWPLKALMKDKSNRRFMPMYFTINERAETLSFKLIERDPEDFDEDEEE